MRRLRRLAGRRAARAEARQFVLEGAKVLAEALRAGRPVGEVFLDAAGAGERERSLASQCRSRGARVHELQPGVLARACDAASPQPIAAVSPFLDVALASLETARPRLVVVCAGLRDPGNAGAVLRSGGAAGAGAVVFCTGSVDLYSPKVVRASAGAVFHLPVVTEVTAEEVLAELGRWGMLRIATAASGGTDYTAVDLAGPTAVVVGNEAHGLPAGLGGLLDATVSIPMASWAESLNAAVAAAVVCYEARRQVGTAGASGAGPGCAAGPASAAAAGPPRMGTA